MAHITALGFDEYELGQAVKDGDVRVQFHPQYPNLAIYNYTEEVQYRNKWNKITLACRGLILDTLTWQIVARPWEKFFNFGQMDNRIESTAPVEVTDKMDGSLGILYPTPDGEWAIATRGSFASEQAIHATKVLRERYLDDIRYSIDNCDYTLLFEIIYPQNRIVVNYGDMDDLVLLGGVHNQYGYYYGPEIAGSVSWTGPETEVWRYDSFVDALSFPDRPGKEGVVIRSGTNIVKLKQADYVELHRIVTNLSPKTVWEMLGAGKTVADICADIPDEFHKYVEDIGNELERKASEIAYDVYLTHVKIVESLGGPETYSRKQYAQAAVKYGDIKKYLFILLDGRDIKPEIWKHIKPRGDIKSLVEDEG